MVRQHPLGLPEVSEVEVVRHYTNLSRTNYGVDIGIYPLGSCTMKYNPKRNDKFANLDGFRYAHPLQPEETLSGLWEVLFHIQLFIAELTGMDFVSLQPAAGAHGELAGLLIVNKYFSEKKQQRKIILVADAAHGTNPATASMTGFHCRIIPTTTDGLLDMAVLKKELNENVAALMITNPSTLGIFEENICEIASLVHANGSLLYYDGANLNALMGMVRPGDMGFDIVHINTHKTLSTPHGGGGPGAGPIGVKSFLRDYLPVPIIVQTDKNHYKPTYNLSHSIGRVKTFYGHIAVLIRAYAYILTMGADGLKEASENAVLSANYLAVKLKPFFTPVFNKFCMHECLVSGHHLPVSAFDFAKRMIDYQVHPPTLLGAGCVYFPAEMESAMLIEPTETETKQSLDNLIDIFYKVVREAEQDPEFVQKAPYSTCVAKIEK